MAYGADFATADAANAPLDAPIMLGADPVLAGAGVLLLLAAVLLGWFLGQRGKGGRPEAVEAIWEEIDDAAKAAMKADGDTLPAKAAALLRTIERRLGNTLGMAGGASKVANALDKAFRGEAGDEPHAPHGTHGHDAGHDDNHGRHDAPPPGPGGVTVIVNNGKGDRPKGDDDHGDHDAKKSLSVQERNDALRVAVGRFNDHWSLRRERVRDLRAAHAELSNPGPKRAAAGRISGTRAGH